MNMRFTQNDFNPLTLIKDSLDELRKEFRGFLKEYHDEVLKVWMEISKLQENLKTVREEQKSQAKLWGLIGGAIPAVIGIGTAILLYWLKSNGGKTP